MIEFRCEKCGKKLAMVKGTAEIKCPRCKKLNRINTEHRESVTGGSGDVVLNVNGTEFARVAIREINRYQRQSWPLNGADREVDKTHKK